MLLALTFALFACAFGQDPDPPKTFPSTFYSWMVVTQVDPTMKDPLLNYGQMIAFDSNNKYSCRWLEQDLVNPTAYRATDYCDAVAGYHYRIADATGINGNNPKCNLTEPLGAPMLPPAYPKDFLDNARYLGVVKVNQKDCNHWFAPSVSGTGSIEFQMDLFADSMALAHPKLIATGDGNPCEISIQNKENNLILTWAFDGFQNKIPDATPCDVPKLLCAERDWVCNVNPKAAPSALQGALQWVCSGPINCAPINPGGSHYNPNTLIDHCNWAFNTYYLNTRLQQGAGACNFSGNAILIPPNSTAGYSVKQSFAITPNIPSLMPLFLIC